MFHVHFDSLHGASVLHEDYYPEQNTITICRFVQNPYTFPVGTRRGGGVVGGETVATWSIISEEVSSLASVGCTQKSSEDQNFWDS